MVAPDADESVVFDRDACVILLRALRSDRVEIHSADSLGALENPLRAGLSLA